MREKFFVTLTILLSFFLLNSCSSYEQFRYIAEEFEFPSQVYNADYNKVWSETYKILSRYELDSFNQVSGIIKTRWIDNTLELNFSDSFGANEAVKAAWFKLIINLSKGYRGSKEVTKVTIFKRQRIEQDFLQGFKLVRSDGILEKSLLYRIDRAIQIDQKLQKIEDQKNKEIEKSF